MTKWERFKSAFELSPEFQIFLAVALPVAVFITAAFRLY